MSRRPLLAGKVAIVSGAGIGLGRAVALSFAREGAQLVLACRTLATAEQIAAEVHALDARAIAVRCDVTDAAERDALIAAAVDTYGGIDVLVNNAFATGRPGPLETADLARHWRASFDVNVFSTLALSQAVLPAMKARGSGAIVMVNSMTARKQVLGLGAYGASKAALLAAAQSLALEVGRYHIRVNSVVPGHIDGPNLRMHFQMEAKRLGISEDEVYQRIAAEGVLGIIPTSEQVAEVVTFLASDMAAAVTGQSVDVNAGQWFH
jgi:NAD(P)-dependent dehydrogenase (short-subunit alcohol dehydrogenase family)